MSNTGEVIYDSHEVKFLILFLVIIFIIHSKKLSANAEILKHCEFTEQTPLSEGVKATKGTASLRAVLTIWRS